MTRLLAFVGPAVLLMVALVELSLWGWFARRAPRFDDYQALVEPVDELRQEGDALLMAPRWAEPMLRGALGDERMPLGDVARPDLDGHATALEVSMLGERAPELSGWRELGVIEIGDFTLRRLANPAPRRVVFDFVAGLSPSSVEVRTPGGSCAWSDSAPPASGGLGGHPTFPPRRFVCPGSPFVNAGVTVIADQDFRARRCIWAHPPARGELTIRYRNVPLGEVLIGHGGMYWIVERERAGAPVELSVRVDGEALGNYIHADGDGWSSFEIPLGARGKRRADVELSVSSPDHRDRHFCFEARTL